MKSRSFPVLLGALVVVIAVVNLFAQMYYWYWRMQWFDIPVHFLGGMWLSGTLLWWQYLRHDVAVPRFLKLFWIGILAAFSVGFVWEIFEAVLSFATNAPMNEIPDTLGDLLSDVLGGATMAVIAWRSTRAKQIIL